MTVRTAVAYGAGHAVISIAGEIDMASEAVLRRAVDAALQEQPDLSELMLDLAGVTFLDSAGVRALLVSHSRAAAHGVTLRVRDPQPTVATVLQITTVGTLLGLTLPAESGRPRRHR